MPIDPDVGRLKFAVGHGAELSKEFVKLFGPEYEIEMKEMFN
jgi:hypothetical protein